MATIDELVIRIKGDVSELEDALDEADRGVSSFGEKMGSLGASIGKGMAVAGAAVAALGALSVKAASDFESSFVSVRQDVNGTVEELDALESSIRSMGASGPVAATELSAVAAALGEVAGIAATDMAAATDSVVKFAQATGTELGAATDLMANFVRTTGTAPDQIDELGSAVVALSSQFKAPEDQILSFTEKLAPMGKDLGISTQALLGLGAAFVGSGVDAGRGVLAVKDVMSDMSAAVAEGGDALAAFAQVAGVSADQFSQKFKTDAAGALADFVAGLQAAGPGAGEVLAGLGIESAQASDAFLRLAQSGIDVGTALSAANTAFAENTALGESAALATETFAAKMATLKNQVLDLGITIGEAILPAVTELVDAIGPILQELAPVVQELAGLIAEALADILPIVKPLLTALVVLIKALIPPLKAILGPVLEVVKVLAAGLTPVITALTPILVMLAETLGRILAPVLGVVSDLLAAVLPIVAELLVAFAPLIEAVLELVLVALEPMLELLGPILEALLPLLEVLVPIAAAMTAVLTPAIKALSAALGFLNDLLAPLRSAFVDKLGVALQFVADLIEFSVRTQVEALTHLASALRDAWDPIADFFSDLWDGVETAFVAVASAIAGAWDLMLAGVKATINFLIQAINTIIRGVNSVISGINEAGDQAGKLPGVPNPANIPDIPTIPLLDVGGEVLRDGLAVLHEGEIVMPAAQVRTPFQPGMGGRSISIVFQNGAIQIPVSEMPNGFDPTRVGNIVQEAIARAIREGSG